MYHEVKLDKILKKNKCLFLAYDQGLEHGPIDFNDSNVDPKQIISIAKRGKFNALIVQKGIAEKYNKEIRKSKIPLIIKLNGKTNLRDGEPISTQICTVNEAIELGAVAVGYTIYIGSEFEPVMMHEFQSIEQTAHTHNLPVIAWIYPRGKTVSKKSPGEIMAYACRVALEIGADMAKIHCTGTAEELAWAVKSAGRCKVVIAGGLQSKPSDFLKQAKSFMTTGIAGFAIGRNIWQAKDPLDITKKVKHIIWLDKKR